MKKLKFLFICCITALYILPADVRGDKGELLEVFSVNAVPEQLPGRWEVTQIVVQKITNGNTATTVHRSAAELGYFLHCPQEWEFTASGTVKLLHADGMEETGTFTVEGDQLKINLPPAGYTYQFDGVNGGVLNVRITHRYSYNPPKGMGRTEQIEENWQIQLRKKQ
jgi:hypothetical protein